MAKIPREVKRAYRYLDVNYNASIEEVKTRARILTKVYRVKNIKSGKIKINKIKKINESAQIIQRFIKTSGVPEIQRPKLDTSMESVFNGLYLLVLISIATVVSYIALL